MPVPGHQTFMRPLLELLSDGEEHIVRDTTHSSRIASSSPRAIDQELIPSGTQSLLHNPVGWAKTYLLKAGLLQSPRRAVVLITDRGRQALAGNQRIDNRYLRQFSEFTDFIRGTGDQDEPEHPPQVPVPPAVETTPEELIRQATVKCKPRLRPTSSNGSRGARLRSSSGWS